LKIFEKNNFLDERSARFKKNTVLLVFCQISNVAISFILVPLTLKYLGVSDYGVWITLVGLIEWFNFFDIGLGHGLRNKYAESKARNDISEIKKYVSTTFFMLILISLGIFLLFIIFSNFIKWSTVLNAPSNLTSIIQNLAIILVGMFCLRFVVNIVSILLVADQNPAISAIIMVFGNVFSLLGTLFLIQIGETSLLSLGIVLSISQVLPLFFAFIYYFSNRYLSIFPRWKYFSKEHLSDIFSFGSRFFMIQLTALMLLQSNNIIIAHVCGLSEVTNFNIAFKYLNVLSTLFMTLLIPLWSASTDAYYKNDINWLQTSFSKLNKIWFLFIFVGISMVLTSPILYHLWLQDSIKPDFLLLTMTLLNVLFLLRSTLYRSFMNGVGKIKLQFLVTFFQAILHIPLAMLMGQYFGVVGVVGVMFLWNFINSCWEPIQFRKIISKSASGIWNK